MNKKIILAVYSFFFLIFASYHAYFLVITGDTLEYYQHFKDIKINPFPFGFEFFVPFLMFVVASFFDSFEFLIFVFFVLWLPLLCGLSLRLTKYPLLFFVLIFFLTPLFFNNASYLIRQYLSVLFFFYYIIFGKNLGLVFALLSLGSHFYSLFLFLFSIPVFYNFILAIHARVLIIFAVSGSLFFSLMSPDFIVEQLYILDQYFGVEGERKLVGIKDGFSNSDSVLSPIILVLNVLIFVFLSLFGYKEEGKAKGFIAASYFSSFLVILFHQYPLIANRFGFLTYFMAIPSLFFCILFFNDKNNRFLTGR